METIITVYTPDRALVYDDVKDFTIDKNTVKFNKKDDQHTITIINCPTIIISNNTD